MCIHMTTTPLTRSEVLEIISTYEGLLSQCNDGEGSEGILGSLAKWEAELARIDGAAL